MIHVLDPGPLNGIQRPSYHFACPECGWCGPLRSMYETAEIDGEAHENLKVRQAERDSPLLRDLAVDGRDEQAVYSCDDCGAQRLRHGLSPDNVCVGGCR